MWHVSRHIGAIFFFNQKTAYEMRIRDWSSDVCSADLGQFLESHLSKTIDTVGDSPRPRKSPGILAHRARNTVSRPHPRGKAHRECIFAPSSVSSHDVCGRRPSKPFVTATSLASSRIWRSEQRRVGKECVRTGRYRW